ncbi:DEAD/DEAH box helicase [Nonomuraea sp. KC401]|uniref:DEAD/DEAH box helicase n=1 Tax=unclassified Nonomuraea TaxID=2593643 RepID=UPI0010FF6175|nr:MULTISPECIES: DEAD/DEAH box helicase [unclassified Nonomuraea]NBE94208.1 DEAD/DEAH box helicase [Nonomuraea sp. K271]TLF77864.1 DEAD/DEAH box helicase [Nonomuraea sp. KC401]
MLDAVMPELGETTPEPGPSEFELLGLPKPLVNGLAKLGFDSPFAIQSATIPDVLAGHDVLGRGQTGSGKTLAFGLPTMARIAGVRPAPGRPKAMILVPTRELALQVHDALEPLGRGLGLRMKVIVGGMSMGKQIEALRRGVDVVIATPGRLGDLIRQGECSLSEIEVSVLDEADHMCDLGFFPVVTELLGQTPADGQRLLFSATLDGDVDKLVRRFLKNPITHSVAPATSPVDTMEHHVMQVTRDDKFDVTAAIANREGRTIIFVRTQHGVDRLCKQLARVGVKAGGLHGGKRQNQRTRILAEFREGSIGVLVCTDVAARGIHVDNISLVLHVDPPQDHKSYLHRGGRTARAGEKGTVVTLVLPNERRSTDALTRRAGIHPFRLKVTAGHPRLAEVTGARTPSGEPVPVWEPDVRKPLRPRRDGGHNGSERRGRRPRRDFDGDRRPRRHDQGGERPFASGDDRGPRREFDGDRRPRRHDQGGERPFSRGQEPRDGRPRGGYRSDDRPPVRQDDRGQRGGFRSDDRAATGPRYASDRGRPFSADRERGYRSDDRAATGPRDGYRSGGGRPDERGPRDGFRSGERGKGGYRRNSGRYER